MQEEQAHPLEPFFRQAFRSSYEGRLGLHERGVDVVGYVARLLCEFSDAAKLYKLRNEVGCSIDWLSEMEKAADPVHGTAPNFDAERAVRKHIGDYALFVGGMYPEALKSSRRERFHHPRLEELIRVGKESYFIVSQFNLFEYEGQAPLFARLSDRFERCILGISMTREDMTRKELGSRTPLMLPSPQP